MCTVRKWCEEGWNSHRQFSTSSFNVVCSFKRFCRYLAQSLHTCMCLPINSQVSSYIEYYSVCVGRVEKVSSISYCWATERSYAYKWCNMNIIRRIISTNQLNPQWRAIMCDLSISFVENWYTCTLKTLAKTKNIQRLSLLTLRLAKQAQSNT